MKKYIFLALIIVISTTMPTFAWDGYDYESGSHIEIEKGNLVRRGLDIEYFDYGTGGYHSGEVQSITRGPSGVEVEVHDYETGETRLFEMED